MKKFLTMLMAFVMTVTLLPAYATAAESNVNDAVECIGSPIVRTQLVSYVVTQQDNTPVMVGMMAASPDGSGFKAKFDNFRITHLPDQRRCEWLKNNQE